MTNILHKLSVHGNYLKKRFFFMFLILGFLSSSCSRNNVDYTKLKENYSPEAISYFSEVGFYCNNNLRKWKKDITISLIGEVKETDIKSVDEFVETFNKMSSTVTMETLKKDGNITINITNDSIMNPGGYVGVAWRYGKFNSSFSNEITDAKILVSPDLDAQRRKEVIHHELLHAVGLEHTKKEFKTKNAMGIYTYKSIDAYENEGYKISELDKMAISILYKFNLPIGLKRDGFLNNLKSK